MILYNGTRPVMLGLPPSLAPALERFLEGEIDRVPPRSQPPAEVLMALREARLVAASLSPEGTNTESRLSAGFPSLAPEPSATKLDPVHEMTSSSAAKALGVTRQAIGERCRRQTIGSRRLPSGRWAVSRADVEKETTKR